MLIFTHNLGNWLIVQLATQNISVCGKNDRSVSWPGLKNQVLKIQPGRFFGVLGFIWVFECAVQLYIIIRMSLFFTEIKNESYLLLVIISRLLYGIIL